MAVVGELDPIVVRKVRLAEGVIVALLASDVANWATEVDALVEVLVDETDEVEEAVGLTDVRWGKSIISKATFLKGPGSLKT